jgi:Pel9A-like, right handed beta helix region
LVKSILFIVCLLLVSLSRLNGVEFFNDWATNNLSSVPSQSGLTDDPDGDGTPNLTEFVFGTDPLTPDCASDAIATLFGGTDGYFGVEIFERAGHRPGVQIDLDATADMVHWIRPWWLRTITNSLPGDPANSVREVFTTYLPGTNVFIVRGVLHLLEAGPEVANYYVATNGNDLASGASTNAPFATLAKAVSVAAAGNLIYVRGGTYVTIAKISLSGSGTAAQPIRIRAYPGEHPILDFSSVGGTSLDAIGVTGSYWQLYGLEVVGAPHNGIKIQGHNTTNPAGSYNTIERCVFRQCGNTGFQLGSSTSTTYIPRSNLVVNCDAYRNYDPPVGGNADGFAAKWFVGPGNVFRGCRGWENSDDGWDLWMAINPVLIENCWAFRNGSNVWSSGSFNGNGNGFKLGGNFVPSANRIVGCVSFQNIGNIGGNGFDQNNNKAGLTVDQNISWSNRVCNFAFNSTTTTAGVHVLRNNISIGPGTNAIQGSAIQTSNSWQVVTSPPADLTDLLSRDTSWAEAARRDDGGLSETPFLRPVVGGRLVDKGANLGAPFAGPAPDLGAFETLVW